MYTPATTGTYTLLVENTRNLTSSTLLYNYIDNISVAPFMANFEGDTMNIPCSTGGKVSMTLKAGIANGNKDYWILMSTSGSFPGFSVGGQTVPLNWDLLLQYGLYNPGFAGSTGFVGKLTGFGMGEATLTLPADPSHLLVGFPIHFAYVLTAPGPALPLSFVSHPMHIKYCP